MSETNESSLANKTGKAKKIPPGSGGKAIRGFSRAHTLAVEIAVAVVAPTLAGWWLDSKTGKEPWFMIAGMVLGGAVVFRSVQRAYHESLRNNRSDDKKPETESSE
jgi:F0F1-type ATP synthase assembly protein I